MKRFFLITVVSISILFSGCNTTKDVKHDNNKPGEASTSTANSVAQVSNDEKVEKPNFTKETYPKIDGSTATIPFSENVASTVLGITKEEAKKIVKHNTTHFAYENLLKGNADIIFVTEPSKEELKMAQDAKVELEVVPIVKEGFVFLVNTKNPIETLSTKQIRDIYQGKIKNWKEVGGEDKELIAYQREKNSGSQTIMEQVVMKDLPLMDAPKNIITSMEGLIDSIAKYDNSDKAFGYSVFYYAKTMYNKDTIKLIAVDGVFPDNKSISSGKYPFTSAYYAVIKKSTPEDASCRKLLKWLLGKEGQKMAEESGYVPLEVK